MQRRHAHGLLLIAALVAAAPRAAAQDTPREEPQMRELVTDTAHTLGEQGALSIGLWRLDVGIFDRLDVGTYTWLWALPFPNFQLKWRIWSDDRWAVALRTGLYYVDFDWIFWTDFESDASAGIFPLELWLTIPLHRDWGLHLGVAWTTVFLDGTYDPDEFQGAAAHDNEQMIVSGEWRLTRVTRLLLTLRWLAFEQLRGDASFHRQLDEYTTVEIVGAAELRGESVRNAASLMLTVVLGWETFHFRFGLGYGNYNVPSINVMIPVMTPIAELDFWWLL